MTVNDDGVALDGDAADDSVSTCVGIGPSDETTIVSPPTAAASELAWSAANETDGVERQPWAPVWGRAAALVACCVAAAIAIGVVGFATVRHRDHDSTPGTLGEPETNTEISVSPAGPALDGAYRLEFYPARASFHGNTPPRPVDSAPTSSWWGFHSACYSNGCSAAGTKLDDTDHERVNADHHQLTLDFVGGAWREATPQTFQQPCGTTDEAETVSMSLTLQPRPNDDMDGTETNTVETNECGFRGNTTQIPVTATRLGAAPAVATPAPPSHPVMVPPPTTAAAPSQTFSDTDEKFLAVLADHGIPTSSFDGGATRAAADGSGTCDALTKLIKDGYSATDVIHSMQTRAPAGASLTEEQSSWFVRLSVSTYCPQYAG